MTQLIKAYGQVLQFPKDMKDEDIASAIKANEPDLNPDYQPPKDSFMDKVKDEAANFAQNSLGVDMGVDSTPRGFSGLLNSVDRGIANTGRMIGATVDTVRGNLSGVEDTAEKSAVAYEKDTPVELKKLGRELAGIDREQSALGQIGDTLSAAKRNPMGTSQLIVEQTPNTAVSLGSGYAGFKIGALTGSIGGPVGTAIGGTLGFLSGMFLGNTLIETGAKAIEKAEGGFTEDEAGEALKEGLIKSGVITGIDAATLKLGGMITKSLGSGATKAGARAEAQVLMNAGVDMTSPATINAALSRNPALHKAATLAGEKAVTQSLSASRKAGIAGTGVTLETVGEGVGEYAGEYAATGEADAVDATIEALAGFSQSAIETAYNYNKLGKGASLADASKAASDINDERNRAGLEKIDQAQTVDEAIAATQETVAQKPVNKDDVLKAVDPTLADLEKLTGLTPSEAISQAEIEAQDNLADQINLAQASQGNNALEGQITNDQVSPQRKNRITLPSGEKLDALWEIVDADSVKATLKSGENQPRDRTRATSDVQIQNIADNPDYDQVSSSPVMNVGAPLLTHDGIIVAGNGRFEGLSQAHEQGKAAEYISALKADAANKGIDASVIDGMKKPVLIRRLINPYDVKKLAIKSNSGLGMDMSDLEQAKVDAELMKGIETLELTEQGDINNVGGNIDKLKYILSGYENNELGNIVDKNYVLSQGGLRRIKAALLAKAYGDSETLWRLIESVDDGSINIRKALTRTAGAAAKVREDIKSGALPKELDVSDSLLGAVETLANIRAKNQPLANYLAQDDIISKKLSAEEEGILQFLHDNIRSQRKLTEFLRSVYANISNAGQTTGGIFDDYVAPSKMEVINDARKQTETTPVEQEELFGESNNKASGSNAAKPNANGSDEKGNGSSEEGLKFSRSAEERLKDRERASRLQKLLRAGGYNHTVTAMDMRDVAVLGHGTQEEAEAAERIAKIFKKRIVWVKVDGSFGINGLIVPSIDDTIFIDVRTKIATHAVMGHELSHHLEQDKPAVYAELVDSLNTLLKDDEGFRKKYTIPEGETRENVVKEMIGDIVGDNFTKQQFWNKVAKANPSAFESIAKAIISWLKNLALKAKTRGLDSEQWVTDANKAQDIIAKAVAQYVSGAQEAASDSATDKAQKIISEAQKDYQRHEKGMVTDMQEGRLERVKERFEANRKAKSQVTELIRLGKVEAIMAGDRYLLSKDPGGKHKWRITSFQNGEPTGHSERSDVKELVDDFFADAVDHKWKVVSSSHPKFHKAFHEDDVSIQAKFSRESKEDKTLIAQHNITPENLLHANRMGGLAAPSLAITDKSTPLLGFGEITLLSDKDLIDPRGGAKVFGADIYSPRYPTLTYKFDDNAVRILEDIISDGIKATGIGDLDGNQISADPIRELESHPSVIAQFLIDEGVNPKIVLGGKPIIRTSLKRFAESGRHHHDLVTDQAFRKEAVKPFEKRTGRKANSDEERNLTNAAYREVDSYRDAIKLIGKTDPYKTVNALKDQVGSKKGRRDKFGVFVANLIQDSNPEEKIFKTVTETGRKYVPHTLDNVIKILKTDVRGGENFNYGLGSLRALHTPQFKSIKEIRESKNKLMDQESFAAVKEEMNAEFDAIRESLQPYGKYSGFDNPQIMMVDYASVGLDRALSMNGFDGVPDNVKKDITEFIAKLKSMPTEYFEVKLLRAVSLGEFKAAVVPKDTHERVIEILKKNGITDIRKYKSGDKKDRVEKINKLDKLFFSRVGKDSIEDSPIEDYRGEHQPPGPEDGAPLYDVTKDGEIYPDDIYSSNGLRYYGTGQDQADRESMSVIQSVKGKRKARVKIYRAVPLQNKELKEEKKKVDTLLSYHSRFNFFPMEDAYPVAYEYHRKIADIYDEEFQRGGITYGELQQKIINHLNQRSDELSELTKKKIKINTGDWVTLSRSYAKEHGESALNGDYEIISKTVGAKELFTNGDSINEFGYWEEGTQGKATDNGDVKFSREETIPDTLTINGTERPTKNSDGNLIHPTEEGIRNFYEWFGESKVLDNQGRPKVVYHGTTSEFNEFSGSERGTNTNASGAERGFFFAGSKADSELYIELAQKRAEDNYEDAPSGIVLNVYLKASNPLILTPFDEANVDSGIVEDLIDSDPVALDYANDNGYDAVIWPHGNINNSAYTAVVFNPNQIKSAIGNDGSFSKDSDDIRFSREGKGGNMEESDNSINSIDDVKRLLDQHKELYVRWSAGPKIDMKPGAVSRDYLSGETHQGLSSVKITSEMSGAEIAKYVGEYTFVPKETYSLKGKGFPTGGYIYTGKEVGTDSDGYPSIKIDELKGKISETLRQELAGNLAERLRLEDFVEEFEWKLKNNRITDAIAVRLIEKRLAEVKSRLREISPPKFSKQAALQKAPTQSLLPGANAATDPQQPETTKQPGDVETDTLPEETRFRKAQRVVQDKFNRFTVIKDFLAKRGINLSEQADVYAAEERYHSKVSNQTEDFREQVRNPLIEKIAKAGFTMADIADYLEAQHAEEANAAMQELHNDPDATAYGITNKEARAYLDKADKKLGRLANEFREITEKTKQLRLDNGLLNTDIVNAWDARYQHYIPVKGNDESKGGKGKGLKVNFKTKRRLGHGRRDEAVIENILMDHERAIMEVEKNRVGKHVVMMIAEAGREDIGTIGKPEKRRLLTSNTSYAVMLKGNAAQVFSSKEAARQYRNMLPGVMKGVAVSDMTVEKITDERVAYSASPMLAPNEINVYIDGHAIRVQLNDNLLAEAYGNLGIEGLGKIFSAGRIFNSYLSKVYTGYNPEFILTNIIRDFSTGIINLTGEEGIKMASKAVANYPSAFASLLKYAVTNGAKSNKWIDAYRANGGNTGAAYLSDMERLGNEVATEYAAYQGVIANLKQGDNANAARAAGKKVFNITLKWIQNLNQAGENAMRLSAFKAMLDSGKTVNEAAHVAKNITVNFNRKGTLGAEANALYLFFNASVQGMAATSHALTKGKHKKQAWALATSMATIGYLMAASLAGGGDEDDYDKIDDYTKERNVLINTEDGFIKIPIPYGYGFFWNFGRIMADAQRKDDLGKAPWRIAASAIEELTPFGDIVGGSEDGLEFDKALIGIFPTVLKIPTQVATNQSTFSGAPLRPESQYDESQPDREKMWRGTQGTMYDLTAGWLESAMGMDVSPETLKFYTRTGTGGAGALVDTTISAAILKAEGATLDAREVPFIRKLYGELTISNDRSAYQKAAGEARLASQEFNRAKRDRDLKRINDIASDKVEMLAMHQYANKLQTFISAARDQQDAIRLSDDYTTQEKRLKLKELEAREAKLYDDYLDVFKVNKQTMRDRAK